MATTSASSSFGGDANWHYDFNVERWVEDGYCCCLKLDGKPCGYKCNLEFGKGVMCKKHAQLGHMDAYLRGEALARQDRDAEVRAAGLNFMQSVASKTGKAAPAALPPRPGVPTGRPSQEPQVRVVDRSPQQYERSYGNSTRNYVISRRDRSPARGYADSVFVPVNSAQHYREVPRERVVERSRFEEPIAVEDDGDSDYVDEPADADDYDEDLRRGLEQLRVSERVEPSVRVSVDKPASIACATVRVESEGAPHEVRVRSERASDRVLSVRASPQAQVRKSRRGRRAGAAA